MIGNTTRLLQLDDIPELAELLHKNREFLNPWDPLRDDEFFTVTKQYELACSALDSYESGKMVPLVIIDSCGSIAGCLNVNGIVRGAFESASLSYWVSETQNGAGLATRAVSDAVKLASVNLKLHRLQAETLIHNKSSQKVLEKNGFTQYGIAPKYLKIAGRWQDHVLFQRLIVQD